MTAKALRVSATTLTLLIGGAAVPMQAQKVKPVTTVAATMTFRCYTSPDPLNTTACDIGENAKVGVTADHIGNESFSTLRLYEGGLLGDSAYLKVTGTGRAFRLFLHPALPAPLSRTDECGAIGALAGCNPDLRLSTLEGGSMLLDNAEVSIRVLNDTTPFDNAPGGLPAMVCNVPKLALVHFTAWLPGGPGHWGLNFNKRAYHSTGATITRVGDKTWVVEATATQYAELVSFGHPNIQRKQGPSHEGRYIVPFQLTIETTGLPSGSTTCAP